jgi:hypothetical protein
VHQGVGRGRPEGAASNKRNDGGRLASENQENDMLTNEGAVGYVNGLMAVTHGLNHAIGKLLGLLATAPNAVDLFDEIVADTLRDVKGMHFGDGPIEDEAVAIGQALDALDDLFAQFRVQLQLAKSNAPLGKLDE